MHHTPLFCVLTIMTLHYDSDFQPEGYKMTSHAGTQ
jgi:hypothetical protein